LIKSLGRKSQTDTESTSNMTEDIEQLREEIEDLERQHAYELEIKKRILTSVEAKKAELLHNVNMTKLKIKEKEQEDKLNDLKAKELNKAVPYNKLKPLRRNQSQSERNTKELESKVILMCIIF
jgi:hypothetical protein